MSKSQKQRSNVASTTNGNTNQTRGISAVLGVNPILPGESAADYQQGLLALIEELEAKTILQVYLAEKIYECLWWLHRYHAQKRAVKSARRLARLYRRQIMLIAICAGRRINSSSK